MILSRLGNKRAIAEKIQAYFPPHEIYIEPFFGAGGMFFYKPLAKYSFLNDLDSDVFNLFQVIIRQRSEFEEALRIMPIHSDLLAYWNKNQETDPVLKAIRFIMLSNMTYMGKPETLNVKTMNPKASINERLNATIEMIKDAIFTNKDFELFLKSIGLRHIEDWKKVLIYCDAPYLGATDNYSNSFTEADSLRLFNALEAMGCKWAMSEFDHPFILEQAKQRGLNVHVIGERQNMKNRRVEILVTNYTDTQLKLF